MAIVEDKEVTLGPWPAGMNNRRQDHALPQGACRNAVNVDFDESGHVRRRTGFSRVYSGLNTGFGWSYPGGVLFVEGNSLKKLNDDNTSSILASNITGTHVAYEYVNGEIFFSDGVITGKIVNGTVVPWGYDAPAAPLMQVVTGALGEGTYLAAYTFVDSLGQESGASSIVSVHANVNSGIKFLNLPSTMGMRLYLSPPNSKTLFKVAEVAAGTSTYSTLAPRYDNDKPLDTKYVSKPLPGQIIEEHKGQLFIASGNVLWYTEPYAFGRVLLAESFFQFTKPITVVESTPAGLWIVADKTYFYADPQRVPYQPDSPAGPKAMQALVRLNYGAILGTSRKLPGSTDVMWYSERGIVVGSSDGDEAVNVQESNIAAESGSVGATLVRDKDGEQQFIASIKDPVVSSLAAATFINMEVIRKAAQ